LDVAQARRILQARQDRLGTQIPGHVRQPTAGQLECRIGPQMIEVVGIRLAAADREHACAEHIHKALHDPRRIAPIRNHSGQIIGQTETPLGHRKKHQAAIRGQTPTIEGSCDFFGVNDWKRDWQNRIISHGGREFAVEGYGVGFATESYATSALYTTLASLSGALWRIKWVR
jgi:hypothetical protein